MSHVKVPVLVLVGNKEIVNNYVLRKGYRTSIDLIPVPTIDRDHAPL